jgi:hypothetical protein
MKKSFSFLTLLSLILITLTGCETFFAPSMICVNDIIVHTLANGNSPSNIQNEIRSQRFLTILAKRKGIQQREITKLKSHLRFHSYGSYEINEALGKNMMDAIELYLETRKAGHSMDYALERLQSEPDKGSLTVDEQLIFAYDKCVCFPRLWIYSLDVKPGTNCVTYITLDGELAFYYIIERTNKRILLSFNFDCVDSKQVLPEYKQVFAEVDAQVSREMKARGSEGLGSCHSYWDRKKELLKKKGIDWKSPSDLQPLTCYD